MKYIAIFVCKILRLVGKLVHKGSSLPGQVALKIDPKILSKIKLPEYVVAVSGSNGKTSTVEMIEQVLSSTGYKVAYNAEGSNQIEGVTTLILDNCTLSGKCKADILLLESDERYARFSFKQIVPTHFVLTNLYRDQLTRNGNPEWIYKCLKEAIHSETELLLNGDDPLVSLFGKDHENTIYFGIDKFTEGNIGIYDDGAYCPNCKSKMKYAYRHYGNVGSFECTECGYRHSELKYHITAVNLDEGYLEIENSCRIDLALKSIYNAYNILAAYSLCRELGVSSEKIVSSLNNYVLKNGRVVRLKKGNNEGMLLISKHENSTSYNQTISVIASEKKKLNVIILVDAISRKYFTSETSWLWDIDFHGLNREHIDRIILTGLYAYDLALRFEYTDIDQNKIIVEPDMDKGFDYLKEGNNSFYVITCFSDAQKVFDRCEVTND
ncbi:MAG: MurT ligase domain-containing protein [Erysipelotrichaceae bacterium]